MTTNIVCTPISKKFKTHGPNSKLDFLEQEMRTKDNANVWCWDDTKYNTARPDDYFAFKFYNEKVIIHKIVSVKNPSDRLPSWASNVGHGDRNVLILSDPLKTLSWEEWVEIGGPKDRMGTNCHQLDKYKGVQDMINTLGERSSP
jgi:hypothetical protein